MVGWDAAAPQPVQEDRDPERLGECQELLLSPAPVQVRAGHDHRPVGLAQLRHRGVELADIRLLDELPKERRFWFYPPFHPTNSVLLHRQADNVLRVDFQLGRDADAEEERKTENIDRRLRLLFGPEARWEHEWNSVYTFACRMMQRFVHGRVIFAGDAAHVVSPFGARGGNGAIADVDNLAWKLALVVTGEAPEALLDSYCSERRMAAREAGPSFPSISPS